MSRAVGAPSAGRTARHNGRVAQHVAALPPSGIRKFFDLVLGVPDVVSLGVGEPDFSTPWNIREQAIYRIETGRTAYTSNHGLMDLREALARWLANRYGLDYDPATEMLITVGASEAIDLALRALLNPGDEVLVLEPCYVSYKPTVALAGGVPVPVPTHQRDGFRPDFAALEAAVTGRTRALIINYPNNPTGATFGPEDLARLQRLAETHDLVVISDEIYAELTYDKRHHSLPALPGMKERTILVSGFSKAHAMTGWRLGYACAPRDLLEAMVKIHQYTMLCAPTLSQYAGLEALEHSDEDVAAMREEYDMRRRLIVTGLNSLGLKTLLPEGAFYAFADITPTGLTSEQFCAELLRAEKVAVVPGGAFGECGEGFFRASYAAGFDRIETALERIGRFLGR
ncbi:MAG: aminotransferase class I/II-fold pyridoxal phosphate-dependent enzyme [Candidatus Sumerlaeaceae bacterium]|nr:aminotransferase class I/II-fold pyridoxal phosphate-dependent enzyme [Candidatus Sumerlaeaceae bacterium]